ncbi:MAG: 4-hydroxythreonine-4-phosphate dehydrogenase PdxA, partial [Planctomycetota bacterium]
MSSTIGKSANFGLPTVAVTIGDPAGIGPEVCLKLLANPEIQSRCRLVILGGYSILQTHSKLLRLPFTTVKIDDISKIESAPSNVVLNIETKDFDKIRLGEVSPESGEAAFNYLQSAMDLAKRNLIDAIVTGPINKLSFNAAGVRFPGHTELFASSFGVENFCMMQYSRLITCSFVTTHVGYQDVVQRLSVERIGNVIRLTHDALNKINGAAPRLVVCGLNPHAGEEGLFGHREEENIIQPAIVKCRSEGMTIEGPLPPDTCFIPAKRETTDGYICMYHDQ